MVDRFVGNSYFDLIIYIKTGEQTIGNIISYFFCSPNEFYSIHLGHAHIADDHFDFPTITRSASILMWQYKPSSHS